MTRLWAFAFSLLVMTGQPALAVNPDEVLADPALEQRARVISSSLRCLVCQNQSIDDSNADLARDLRVIVRERLKAGDNDRQIIDYLRARYGDFVLLKPPVERATWLLWFGPPIALVAVLGAGLFLATRRRGTQPPPPLTDAERRELDRILAGDAM
jgi:cytochrome c-type biogenesis protein CcmH